MMSVSRGEKATTATEITTQARMTLTGWRTTDRPSAPNTVPPSERGARPGRPWPPTLVGCSVSGLVAPFVVGGAELAEGGVPPARVVEALDEVEDGHAGLGMGAELLAVEQLALQGGKETLGHGVVVGVPD